MKLQPRDYPEATLVSNSPRFMKTYLKLCVFLNVLIGPALSLYAQSDLQLPVSNTIKIEPEDSKEEIISKAAHVVPTKNQLEALKDGFVAFVHLGPNSFTKMEWGTGKEDPQVFALQNLDTDQWCKAMKEAGMTKVILTAKHHDGFVLWQSRYTDHGIMSSPFKAGKGDIMKELAESCKKYGLKLGVYLSPADLYQIENPEGLYGNLSEATKRTIPREVPGRPFKNKTTFEFEVDDYNEYFLNQLFELLTEYGPVHEVWFDGAHPKRKGGQTYNYAAWKEVIRTLAPKAVIFGKEDIRWVGNESGATRSTEWNVIPYEGNPETMNIFGDITGDSIGQREKLYDADYLHYQPAEVNTSIREGWFYRDEESQKVRNADDVFDIFERSVGGNAIFLLNIPPNRKGRFSEEDVSVLKEVGERIKKTYGKDLFATTDLPEALKDNKLDTFVLLEEEPKVITITAESAVTINRFRIQEAVATHGERIEAHQLEAFVDGSWEIISKGTNVGFNRILRFPEVTAKEFRLLITQSRATPAVAKISAHYYAERPPQIEITRSADGMITLAPKKDEFTWKRDPLPVTSNDDMEIEYWIDGGDLVKKYEAPFRLNNGTLKAVAVKNGIKGSESAKTFGLLKQNWKIIADSSRDGNLPEMAIDADPDTFWVSGSRGKPHYLEIDLGAEVKISAFGYTPETSEKTDLIENGIIKISEDGENWKLIEVFNFGNLINDPTQRVHQLKRSYQTRYVRIEAISIAGQGNSASAAEIDFF